MLCLKPFNTTILHGPANIMKDSLAVIAMYNI